MRRLAGGVLSSLRCSIVGRVQKTQRSPAGWAAQAAAPEICCPAALADKTVTAEAAILFFKSLALYTACDTVALVASLPPVSLAFLTSGTLVTAAYWHLAHAVPKGAAPAPSFLGPLALRVLSQKQQLPARFGVPVRIAAYCASCGITGPILGLDMGANALAEGYAREEGMPMEEVPITGRLRPASEAVTGYDIYVRRRYGQELQEHWVYKRTPEGKVREKAAFCPPNHPLTLQAEALRDQLLEAATALILERQGDRSAVLHKHLTHFHRYKPPVKVLASQCDYHSAFSGECMVLKPEEVTSSPLGRKFQGGLALATAEHLAPIILHHSSERTAIKRSAEGGTLWFFTSMGLRMWVDRGLMPAVWISSGLLIRLLINYAPSLLGQRRWERPESLSTELLRKALPSGFLPDPAPGSGVAILKSISQSDELRDIQSNEAARVALLLLARAGFDPRMALSKTQVATLDELLEDPAALQAAETVVVPPAPCPFDIDPQALRNAERRRKILYMKSDANLARALQEASEVYAKQIPRPL